MHRWIGILVVQGVVLFGIAAAFAEEADPETKAAFEKGKALYQEGRFEEALAAFTEAYNRTGEPKLLFNLAASAEGMGDRERAKAYYQVYLEELPDAEDAPDVKERIKRLSEPSSSSPSVSAETKPAVGSEPVDKQVSIPDTENVDAREYYKKKEDKKKRPLWPALTMGLGGMVLVGGTITAILAKSKYNGLESSCKPDCTDEQIASAKASAVASDVQFAVGGVAVTAGLIGWFLLRKKIKEHAHAALVTPIGGADHVGLVLEGRF